MPDIPQWFWSQPISTGWVNERNESYRSLALALVEHHKRTCDGATCNISLGSLREMAEAAGACFTPEESARFF